MAETTPPAPTCLPGPDGTRLPLNDPERLIEQAHAIAIAIETVLRRTREDGGIAEDLVASAAGGIATLLSIAWTASCTIEAERDRAARARHAGPA